MKYQYVIWLPSNFTEDDMFKHEDLVKAFNVWYPKSIIHYNFIHFKRRVSVVIEFLRLYPIINEATTYNDEHRFIELYLNNFASRDFLLDKKVRGHQDKFIINLNDLQSNNPKCIKVITSISSCILEDNMI